MSCVRLQDAKTYRRRQIRLLLASIAVTLAGPIVYWLFARSEEGFPQKMDAVFAFDVFVLAFALALRQIRRLLH